MRVSYFWKKTEPLIGFELKLIGTKWPIKYLLEALTNATGLPKKVELQEHI